MRTVRISSAGMRGRARDTKCFSGTVNRISTRWVGRLFADRTASSRRWRPRTSRARHQGQRRPSRHGLGLRPCRSNRAPAGQQVPQVLKDASSVNSGEGGSVGLPRDITAELGEVTLVLVEEDEELGGPLLDSFREA